MAGISGAGTSLAWKDRAIEMEMKKTDTMTQAYQQNQKSAEGLSKSVFGQGFAPSFGAQGG